MSNLIKQKEALRISTYSPCNEGDYAECLVENSSLHDSHSYCSTSTVASLQRSVIPNSQTLGSAMVNVE